MSIPIARDSQSLPYPDTRRADPVASTPRFAAKVDRSKLPPELIKAAEGMEGMFIDYMMQVMRQTVPDNAMGLDSSASKIYQGMLDSEYAEMATKQGGIGLADQIIAYMSEQRYNQDGQGPRGRATVEKVNTGYGNPGVEVKQGRKP